MPFKELEHTADVRIRVDGSTLDEVFAESARGMFQVMYGSCRGESVSRTLSLESSDLDSLLVEFLSELLFISEVDGVVFCSFEVKIMGNSLDARLFGEDFDRSRHEGREIKGISYSGLSIEQKGDVYTVEILFDV